MNEGISLEEACSKGLIGTEEDFERNCNEDGTVKEHPETTTFSLKDDSSKSVTIDNTHLQAAIVGITVLAIVLLGLLVRKIIKRNKRQK